jgi:multicomponent Na+:H+ antiporter subunit E
VRALLARRRRHRQGWAAQLPLVVALAALWVLLWDDLSWGNVAAGSLLAVGVTRVFFLPAVELSGRVNLYWLLVYVVHFAVDLVRGGAQVVGLALSPRHLPHNAVIAVNLHTSSDLLMTMTGQTVSLVPGSLIVEADRRNTTLYLHVLDADDEETIESIRRNILRIEERLIRALGSREEIETLDAERLATGRRSMRWRNR